MEEIKWRQNFKISDCNFNLVHYEPEAIFNFVRDSQGKALLPRAVFDYQEGALSCLLPAKDIERATEALTRMVAADPKWADELHRRTETYNDDYFAYGRRVLQKDISALANDELVSYIEELRAKQRIAHFSACATTWFMDSDGERYSDHIRSALRRELASRGITDEAEVMDIFILLTTPARESLADKEYEDFLRLILALQEEGIHPTPDNEKIKAHHNTWSWTPYGYTGPPYTAEHYAMEAARVLTSGEDPALLLHAQEERIPSLREEQKAALLKLKLPADLEQLFEIARDIIWLKDYRKYCLWHGHYVLDTLTKEVARRAHCTHRQANHLYPREIRAVLDSGAIDENAVNERMKRTTVVIENGQKKILHGNAAAESVALLDIEDTLGADDGRFVGSCACPGNAEGPVKIVHTADDIGKVEQGDILLALTTYPSFLPAMKKAAAIVTEDGGITCHAAIVAREFRIPCVVGAKKITELLRDGQRVSVDATHGVVTT